MTSTKILNIIQKYHDQLSRTRRVMVLKKALRLMEPSEDRVTLSREGKRRELIDKLSKEIINNLIVSEEPEGIAGEIKEKIEEQVGIKLLFEFDPKEKAIIVRKENKMRFSERDQEKILKLLKTITKEKLEQIVS